jgi:hypothetical protein
LIGVAATVLPFSTRNGFFASGIAPLLVAIVFFVYMASVETLALAAMPCGTASSAAQA